MQYTFGTPLFDEGVSLRNQVLRVPLNLQFDPQDIADEWTQYHLGLFNQDFQMLATLTLKLQDNAFKMRQVAVLPEMQGKGIGRLIVEYAEQFALQNDIHHIVLHARAVAIPFYFKMGYSQKGNPFEEVGIEHIMMEKKL